MQLREGQQVTALVVLLTLAGHPAAYEKGSGRWTSSDDSIATVEANPENELEAVVKGVDGSTNGAALITFEADGDPDADEERDVIATLDVVVTQGEAVVAEITTGPVSDIPAPAPEQPAPAEGGEVGQTSTGSDTADGQ